MFTNWSPAPVLPPSPPCPPALPARPARPPTRPPPVLGQATTSSLTGATSGRSSRSPRFGSMAPARNSIPSSPPFSPHSISATAPLRHSVPSRPHPPSALLAPAPPHAGPFSTPPSQFLPFILILNQSAHTLLSGHRPLALPWSVVWPVRACAVPTVRWGAGQHSTRRRWSATGRTLLDSTTSTLTTAGTGPDRPFCLLTLRSGSPHHSAHHV